MECTAVLHISKRTGFYYSKAMQPIKQKRSTIIIKENKDGIDIEIKATDTPALYAALKSTLNEIRLMEEISSVSDNSINRKKVKIYKYKSQI
ncbi:hypothetical protein M1373_02355 [Candidatus Marsarchaeota archaeon]|nr:hypothetical protein [Candidatus Marsarchaeota archaeon]MCL5404860.1 hypothetical protein [Candidatus Marsarchaeota archaeon]